MAFLLNRLACALLVSGFLSPLITADYSWAASRAKVSTHKKTVQSNSQKKASAKGKNSARLAKKPSPRKIVANKGANERALWLDRLQKGEIYTGKASWYGKDFHNKPTASGLTYDMHTFTAAHKTLPIGTIVKVTDQASGKSVMVCVTDRGPYTHGRIIDLSYAAAKQLGLNKKGVGNVALEVVSDAQGVPLKKDKAFFIKYSGGGGNRTVGPFHIFADAAAMQEALRLAHPEAEVFLDNK